MLETGIIALGNPKMLVLGLSPRYTSETSVFTLCEQDDPGFVDFDKLDCDRFMKKFQRREINVATLDLLKHQRNPVDN